MGNFGTANAAEANWRVGHRGRDQMFYEERVNGHWLRIEIQGEMLLGEAHRIIYFASNEQWQAYPEWARQRRTEIIARVKTQFHAPDYLYYGGSGSTIETVISDASAAKRKNPQPKVQGLKAVSITVVLVLGLSLGMAGLVATGIKRGETTGPANAQTSSAAWCAARNP